MNSAARFLSFFIAATLNFASAANAQLTDRESAGAALKSWVRAANSRTPSNLAVLYDPRAIVLMDSAERPLDTPEERDTYFKKLASLDQLNVTVDDENLRLFDNMAVNSGTYRFSYQKNGTPVEIPGHFSFVYRKAGNQWLIVDHHTSAADAAPMQAQAASAFDAAEVAEQAEPPAAEAPQDEAQQPEAFEHAAEIHMPEDEDAAWTDAGTDLVLAAGHAPSAGDDAPLPSPLLTDQEETAAGSPPQATTDAPSLPLHPRPDSRRDRYGY